MDEKLILTEEWDKTFPESSKVKHRKVTFRSRFGITLAADLYEPSEYTGRLSAIAVSGPFGAVKEQASGLYAQTMAERGFLTLAFDPSFTGESGGQPRYVASPDINTEDFQAAVDFLSVQENVDPQRIGIIGICGWDGMALNAAAIDTRIKATVTSTMYDMTRVTANGYFDAADNEQARFEARCALNAQRTEDFRAGSYKRAGGVVDPVPEDAPFFVKDYHDYYKTARGYHKRSLNSNEGWNVTSSLSFMNARILTHLAFYAGWPNAWAAFRMAKEVYADGDAEAHGGIFGLGEPNTAYAKYFTGSSYLKPLTVPGETVFLANVTFEPGCRNNWHIHHASSGGGQILICVDGEGWYQEEGKEAVSLTPGMVVTIPANVKHWHGAKAGSWFSHIAVEVPGSDCSNEWCEPVSDEWYNAL